MPSRLRPFRPAEIVYLKVMLHLALVLTTTLTSWWHLFTPDPSHALYSCIYHMSSQNSYSCSLPRHPSSICMIPPVLWRMRVKDHPGSSLEETQSEYNWMSGYENLSNGRTRVYIDLWRKNTILHELGSEKLTTTLTTTMYNCSWEWWQETGWRSAHSQSCSTVTSCSSLFCWPASSRSGTTTWISWMTSQRLLTLSNQPMSIG